MHTWSEVKLVLLKGVHVQRMPSLGGGVTALGTGGIQTSVVA